MANLTSTLTLKLTDGLSGPAKQAADSLKGLGLSAQQLNAAVKFDLGVGDRVDRMGVGGVGLLIHVRRRSEVYAGRREAGDGDVFEVAVLIGLDAEQRDLVAWSAVGAPAIGALASAHLDEVRDRAGRLEETEENAHHRSGFGHGRLDADACDGEVEGEVAGGAVRGEEFERGLLLILRQRRVEGIAVEVRAECVEVGEYALDVRHAARGIGRIWHVEPLVRLVGRDLKEAQIEAQPRWIRLRIRGRVVLKARIFASSKFDVRRGGERDWTDRKRRGQGDDGNFGGSECGEGVVVSELNGEGIPEGLLLELQAGVVGQNRQ